MKKCKHPEAITRTFLILTIVFSAIMSHPPAWGQELETVLFEEDFEGTLDPPWELEPGWSVTDGMLRGEGHHWAQPAAGSWKDFRLTFRLRLQQGGIHLVYRMNDTGRYFFGFHEDGSYLKKQYWPDTFIDLVDHFVTPRDLGNWCEIEIAGAGDELLFFVDGVLELEYIDPDPLGRGGFAFETLDDSVAYIDDVRVFGQSAGTSQAWIYTGGPLGGLGLSWRDRQHGADRPQLWLWLQRGLCGPEPAQGGPQGDHHQQGRADLYLPGRIGEPHQMATEGPGRIEPAPDPPLPRRPRTRDAGKLCWSRG